MKLGILQCGDIKKEMEKDHLNYRDLYRKMFSYFRHIELKFYDIRAELPDKLDCDAYIITGSLHSVNERKFWYRPLVELLHYFDKNKIPVIGICFGHQFIAKTFGGEVKKADRWGVGLTESRVLKHKHWMTPRKNRLNLLAMHQEQVYTLPRGAEIIADNTKCPVNVFTLRKMLCFQYHPEYESTYCKARAMGMLEKLGEINTQLIIRGLVKKPDSLVTAKWIVNFIKGEL